MNRLSGKVHKGQHERRLDKEGKPRDLADGKPHAGFKGWLERHDERQMLLGHSGFLKNGVDVDAVPPEGGADTGQDARTVAHDEAKIKTDEFARGAADGALMPFRVTERSASGAA